MFKMFLYDVKMLFRNKQSLFWSFMFPVMFTFIFGFFFGENNSSGTLGFVNKSNSELSKTIESVLIDQGNFKIDSKNSLDDARDPLKKNKISAIVYIPENFGNQVPNAPTEIELIYDKGDAQIVATANGIINQVLTSASYQIQNAKPIFSVKQTESNQNPLTYFDFVLAGILGMALMNSSINGIAISMSKYREDKILKRLVTTPMKIWSFVSGEVLSRLIINFIQISIILIIGKYLFDAHIYGNLIIIYLVAIVGAAMFQLMGFAIASFSKTTAAAEGMATAVAIPMMFLAGVFFPTDSLPAWLGTIVQYLPLAPLLEIIRGVALDSSSPFINSTNVIIVLAWIVVMLFISIKKFKFYDE